MQQSYIRTFSKFMLIMLGSFGLQYDRSIAQQFDPRRQISYCTVQAQRTLKQLPQAPPDLPRSIPAGGKTWTLVDARDWCSGFWPGILWYLYENDRSPMWQQAAEKATNELAGVTDKGQFDHDLGFMIFNSYGHGYELTRDPGYKKIVLKAADSLATLFNPKVGTILSWPNMRQRMGWPHNTIIDNMMNLELLFWAAKNGGDHRLYDIALRHAETTMHNQFRPDHSVYHVVVYDTISGKKIKGVTHQGYSDGSMWARGQSWAIYGFTMTYRETRKAEFLRFAEKLADRYLSDLPAGLIPFWDFNDPGIPGVSRDASAACVTASALLELSTLVKDRKKAASYRERAKAMLAELSKATYQSREVNSSFLLHSTGHRPAGTEIDASIIYADYYYLEALTRLKKLQNKSKI